MYVWTKERLCSLSCAGKESIGHETRSSVRVPVARALRLTLDFSMEFLHRRVRHGAMDTVGKSVPAEDSFFFCRWSGTLGMAQRTKAPRIVVLYFFVKATMEVVWWPEVLMRLELLGGFDGSIAGVGWPSSLQTLEFGDAFDQNIGGDTLPASLQQLSSGFSFNQPVVGIGWADSLRRLKFGYELQPTRRRRCLAGLAEGTIVRACVQPTYRRSCVACLPANAVVRVLVLLQSAHRWSRVATCIAETILRLLVASTSPPRGLFGRRR